MATSSPAASSSQAAVVVLSAATLSALITQHRFPLKSPSLTFQIPLFTPITERYLNGESATTPRAVRVKSGSTLRSFDLENDNLFAIRASEMIRKSHQIPGFFSLPDKNPSCKSAVAIPSKTRLISAIHSDFVGKSRVDLAFRLPSFSVIRHQNQV